MADLGARQDGVKILSRIRKGVHPNLSSSPLHTATAASRRNEMSTNLSTRIKTTASRTAFATLVGNRDAVEIDKIPTLPAGEEQDAYDG